jgi:hypothetical protein
VRVFSVESSTALDFLNVYRSFATKSVTTQNLAFLSYWYRKKRLQINF